MRTYAPSPRSRPFVHAFVVVEVDAAVTRLRLPDPGAVLGLRYAGAASVVEHEHALRLPDTSLAGVAARARTMRTDAHSGVVLVRFRPAGAARFFSAPMNELFGRTAALDDYVPRRVLSEVEGRLDEARTDAERIAAIESFLLRIERDAPVDPMVLAALSAMEGSTERVQMRRLARQLGTSLDPLEKRFRRVVGTSPRTWMSIARLHRAIASHRPDVPLARLAVQAGYFDEPHMHRAFRDATGMPPKQVLGRE